MAANAAGICTSFKVEMLQGFHALSSAFRAADTLKAALYLQSQSIGPATTVYSVTGEVSGSGYTAGGVTVGSAFDCWLLYNSSQSNRAILAATFAAQTITAGNFVITMPTNAAGSA